MLNSNLVSHSIVTALNGSFSYFMPVADNAFVLFFSIIICNFLIFISIRILYRKAMFLFMFLFYFIILMLHFGFNQFIGFFFLVEVTALIFIVTISFEMNFFLKEEIINKKKILFISMLCVSTIFSGFYYFNKFVYPIFYVFYPGLRYATTTTLLYTTFSIMYSGNSMYIFYISLFFVVVTFVIIAFYKNYKASKINFKGGTLFNLYFFLKNYKRKQILDKETIRNINKEGIYSFIKNPKNFRFNIWR